MAEPGVGALLYTAKREVFMALSSVESSSAKFGLASSCLTRLVLQLVGHA